MISTVSIRSQHAHPGSLGTLCVPVTGHWSVVIWRVSQTLEVAQVDSRHLPLSISSAICVLSTRVIPYRTKTGIRSR
eukprot:scaffold74284_cov19-Prasinocladus_malaysianus.AAC.1